MQELTLEIINNDKDIHWHHKKRKISQIGRHFQDYYEITLILDGKAKNIVSDTIYVTQKNDIVFMNKNVIHELISCDSDKSLKYINLAFSDRIMSRIQIIFPNFSIPDLSFIVHLSSEKTKKLINIYNEINLTDSYQESNKDIELFLYQMIKEMIYQPNSIRNLYPNWFKTLLLEIQNIERVKDTHDIFKKSPYSKQYTIKKFHEYLNMTPTQYLNKTKINRSIELLLSTELSIAIIAFECGFNNVEYFDKIFKRNMGMTPIRYRQTQRQLIKETKS